MSDTTAADLHELDTDLAVDLQTVQTYLAAQASKIAELETQVATFQSAVQGAGINASAIATAVADLKATHLAFAALVNPPAVADPPADQPVDASTGEVPPLAPPASAPADQVPPLAPPA